MVLSTGEETSHNVLYLAYVLALSLSCFIPAMLILTLEEQESCDTKGTSCSIHLVIM